MQRKFLEDLGLEKEIIDKVMAENGVDIEKTKTTLNTQIEDLQSQLTTAKDTLKSFEGVDVKELQGKIAELQTNLTAKETEYQNKISDMEFNSILDNSITSFGAKNSKSVMALLDIDSLKKSKNQAEDIKKALEQVKTDNDYLFASSEPIKSPVKDTNNPNITGLTKETFGKMGYAERINLKKNDPQKYEELKG